MELGADMSKFVCCHNMSPEASGLWATAESMLQSSDRLLAVVLALGVGERVKDIGLLG